MTSMSSNTFWQNAYQKYAPKLLGLCRRYVSDLNIAQDLMHDAFITAINKHDTFSNKGSFEGWLSRIAVNTVLMHLRKEKKWMQSIDEVELSDDYEDDSEEPKDSKSLILNCGFGQEDLLLAIDQLPLHHKAVFNLYVFENFSHQQIADSLHISVGTSKSHLARARKRIQNILLQKAIEMKKKDRKVAIIPFFVSDNNFIDELYKNELSNLEFTPSSVPPGLETLMNSTSISAAKSTTWFGFAKAKILSVAIFSVIGTAMIVSLLQPEKADVVQNNNYQDSVKKENIPIEENKVIDSTIKTITNQEKTERQSKINKPLKRESNDEIPEKQTIIVKKQVIKKDTVHR